MIRRKKANAYLEDESDNNKSFCSKCWSEDEVIIYTVPYKMSDGRIDKGFRFCEECKRIIPKSQARYSSIVGVLGREGGLEQSHFETVTKRRKIDKNVSEPEFNPSDYPIAGGRDGDLEYFNSIGVVTSVTDSGIDSEE